MAYADAQLGDIGSDIANWLDNFRQQTANIQTATRQLGQKVAGAGDVTVRVSNAATGAAAGAQAGSQLPVSDPIAALLAQIPKPVLYGGAALLAYKLLTR
jgi:hypothetical protein